MLDRSIVIAVNVRIKLSPDTDWFLLDGTLYIIVVNFVFLLIIELQDFSYTHVFHDSYLQIVLVQIDVYKHGYFTVYIGFG